MQINLLLSLKLKELLCQSNKNCCHFIWLSTMLMSLKLTCTCMNVTTDQTKENKVVNADTIN